MEAGPPGIKRLKIFTSSSTASTNGTTFGNLPRFNRIVHTLKLN